jgi:uncharacterized Ntn-hydrolase superfamily protein
VIFSIIGRSPDGSALGVAVASKFLAAGAYAPPAAGRWPPRPYGNLVLRAEGLDLLRRGHSADQLLATFFETIPHWAARVQGVRPGAAFARRPTLVTVREADPAPPATACHPARLRRCSVLERCE